MTFVIITKVHSVQTKIRNNTVCDIIIKVHSVQTMIRNNTFLSCYLQAKNNKPQIITAHIKGGGEDSQLDKEKVAGDITIQNDFITKTTQVTGLLFLKLDIDTTKHISSPHRS